MAKEIERKFIVTGDSYRESASSCRNIRQGYLSRDADATVRVRTIDDRAYLTVKGRNRGIVRDEWEYEIPVADAIQMLERCCKGTVIVKKRYLVKHEGYLWEIDEFMNPAGMPVMAEVELADDQEKPPLPDFIGMEVTGNPSYYNSNL